MPSYVENTSPVFLACWEQARDRAPGDRLRRWRTLDEQWHRKIVDVYDEATSSAIIARFSRGGRHLQRRPRCLGCSGRLNSTQPPAGVGAGPVGVGSRP